MKKMLLVLLVIIGGIIPLSVNAENKIRFEEENSIIVPGGKKKVNIIVDSDKDFSNVSFNLITTSPNIGFYSVDISDMFTRNNTGAIGYDITSKKPMKSGTVVGSVTLVAKENTPVGSSGNIRITKGTIDKIDTSITQVKMVVSNEKSSNNSLSSIISNMVNIDFNKDVLEYTVEVPKNVKEFDLEVTPEDSSATVTISSKKLIKKKNVITIDVKAQNGDVKTYKLNVNKKDETKEVVKDNDKEISKKVTTTKKNETNDKSVKTGWYFILIPLVLILFLDILFIKKKH